MTTQQKGLRDHLAQPFIVGRVSAEAEATTVIASEAKQSMLPAGKDGLLRRFTPRNGGVPIGDRIFNKKRAARSSRAALCR
jgi:hypothetical protein